MVKIKNCNLFNLVNYVYMYKFTRQNLIAFIVVEDIFSTCVRYCKRVNLRGTPGLAARFVYPTAVRLLRTIIELCARKTLKKQAVECYETHRHLRLTL